MTDKRLYTLACNIFEYSLSLKKGQSFMVRGPLSAKPLIAALIKRADEMGIVPHVRILDEEINRWLLMNASDGRIEAEVKWDLDIYGGLDADIYIESEENNAELSAIDPKIMQRRAQARRPWVDFVCSQRKWVILN